MAGIVLTVDIRERAVFAPLQTLFEASTKEGVTMQSKTLDLGDFNISRGGGGEEGEEEVLFIVERKTWSDLTASIVDGRFSEQSFRLKHASGLATPNQVIYLLEGPLPADASIRAHYIRTMMSLQAFKGFSIARTNSATETAEFLFHSAQKICEDLKKGRKLFFEEDKDGSGAVHDYMETIRADKSLNRTASNIGQIFLCNIPSVGATAARAIMLKYNDNFAALMADIDARGPAALQDIQTEQHVVGGGTKRRKLACNIGANIAYFLYPLKWPLPVETVVVTKKKKVVECLA